MSIKLFADDMSKFTEAKLEQAIIDLLGEKGYPEEKLLSLAKEVKIIVDDKAEELH